MIRRIMYNSIIIFSYVQKAIIKIFFLLSIYNKSYFNEFKSRAYWCGALNECRNAGRRSVFFMRWDYHSKKQYRQLPCLFLPLSWNGLKINEVKYTSTSLLKMMALRCGSNFPFIPLKNSSCMIQKSYIVC